jgi:hypothetical protein
MQICGLFHTTASGIFSRNKRTHIAATQVAPIKMPPVSQGALGPNRPKTNPAVSGPTTRASDDRL